MIYLQLTFLHSGTDIICVPNTNHPKIAFRKLLSQLTDSSLRKGKFGVSFFYKVAGFGQFI